jgi:uncharacterized protein
VEAAKGAEYVSKEFWAISTGIIVGTIARYWMMRRDVRQYPSYPHAVVNHLALGFLAATLGAVAVPALAASEFTAVTFLALAATQFREVRSMERQMLDALEHSELVPRGKDFIEGIARTFEARNYLVLFVALVTSGVTLRFTMVPGILAGIIATAFVRRFMRGKVVKDIAKVRPGEFRFEGANLFVEDIHIMNLGLKDVRETYLERAKAVVLEPFDDNGREILANVGQRQAIAHEAASLLGVHRDVDTAEFTPLLRRNPDTGRIGMIIVPLEPDSKCLVMAVENVPVLESAVVNPLGSRAGRCASD